jgi:hypothetical protein
MIMSTTPVQFESKDVPEPGGSVVRHSLTSLGPHFAATLASAAVGTAIAVRLAGNTIATVKQVLVSLFEPDGLAKLLERPGGTRMRGGVTMNQAPAAVLDHHEHMQQPQRGGDGNKEVARNDSLGVKTQER